MHIIIIDKFFEEAANILLDMEITTATNKQSLIPSKFGSAKCILSNQSIIFIATSWKIQNN